MNVLLNNISQCSTCKAHLPLGPRPVVTAHPKSKIVIIGQAPGKRCISREFLGMIKAVKSYESG